MNISVCNNKLTSDVQRQKLVMEQFRWKCRRATLLSSYLESVPVFLELHKHAAYRHCCLCIIEAGIFPYLYIGEGDEKH